MALSSHVCLLSCWINFMAHQKTLDSSLDALVRAMEDTCTYAMMLNSWIIHLAFGYLVATPLFGILSDKYQNRRYGLMLGTSCIISSTLLFAWSSSYTVLAIARVCQGASAGASWYVFLWSHLDLSFCIFICLSLTKDHWVRYAGWCVSRGAIGQSHGHSDSVSYSRVSTGSCARWISIRLWRHIGTLLLLQCIWSIDIGRHRVYCRTNQGFRSAHEFCQAASSRNSNSSRWISTALVVGNILIIDLYREFIAMWKTAL